MTGSVDLRPGFAKRADNFAAVAARAGAFTPCAMRRLDIDRAVAQGTPFLSDGARSLLHFYLTHLSMRDIEAGRTEIWAGTAAAIEALGVTESSLRRRKRELEAAGLIVRQYDRRNRPMENAGIDLAPFLEKVPALLDELSERLAARRARFAEARLPEEGTENAITTAQAVRNDRLKQSPFEESESCTVSSEKKGGGEDCAPQTTAAQAAREAHEDARTLRLALDLSPKLRAALTPNDELISVSLAASRLKSILDQLFPDAGNRNPGHTFLWAARRYGAGAWLRLAVAVEDPAVKDPLKYFGWLATTEQAIDISPNLERLKTLNPRPSKLDAPGDHFGREAAKAIADAIGVDQYNAWLPKAQTRFATIGDALLIETDSPFALRKLAELQRELDRAAGRLGFDGVTVRMAT